MMQIVDYLNFSMRISFRINLPITNSSATMVYVSVFFVYSSEIHKKTCIFALPNRK